MKRFAILSLALGALGFLVVTLVPQPADAGWRKKAWRHGYAPNVYVAPRWGYYVPRCGRYGRRCRSASGYPYAYYPYWRGRYQRGWYY